MRYLLVNNLSTKSEGNHMLLDPGEVTKFSFVTVLLNCSENATNLFERYGGRVREQRWRSLLCRVAHSFAIASLKTSKRLESLDHQ